MSPESWKANGGRRNCRQSSTKNSGGRSGSGLGRVKGRFIFTRTEVS